MAIQLYLSDYDRMWPVEHDAAAVQMWLDFGCDFDDSTLNATVANPYLREPVILDEYIKNRDVWSCPSARFERGTPVITSTLPGRPYWQDWLDNADIIGCPPAIDCGSVAFPPGWGGAVTDSLSQRACGGGEGSFVWSISPNWWLHDLKMSSVNDVAKFVATGEGTQGTRLEHGNTLAYGDLCGNDEWYESCGDAPSEDCPWTFDCQFDGEDEHFAFWSDASVRKTYARHLGGVNIGFLDGHASWWSSEAVLAASQGGHGPDPDRMVLNPSPQLEANLCVCTP